MCVVCFSLTSEALEFQRRHGDVSTADDLLSHVLVASQQSKLRQ